MPTTVLTAQETAERCYLSEALEWVALQRYPLAAMTEDGVDFREDEKNIEGLAARTPFEETVTGAECHSAGLPINPEWEAEQAGEYHSPPNDIRRYLTMDLGEPDRAKLRLQLEESEKFHARQAEWNEEYEAYLDVHAAKLYLALREGKIPARGKKLHKATIEESTDFYAETDWEGFDDIRWESIPPTFWTLNRIDWAESQADGRGCCFGLILVDVEKLLAAFPLLIPLTASTVYRVNDSYVFTDQDAVQHGGNVRGRPSFDWQDFHVEMARRAQIGALPDKQEALIAEMQNWCLLRWRKPVARSTMLQKVKPYYDALVRKS